MRTLTCFPKSAINKRALNVRLKYWPLKRQLREPTLLNDNRGIAAYLLATVIALIHIYTVQVSSLMIFMLA